MSQKTEMKRAKDMLAALQKQEDEERDTARLAARERVLQVRTTHAQSCSLAHHIFYLFQEFERGQLSVGKRIGEKTGIGEKRDEKKDADGASAVARPNHDSDLLTIPMTYRTTRNEAQV